MGDKIGVLNKGRLVQVGTPAEVYNAPINTFVARSVGSPPMNLMRGILEAGEARMRSEGFTLPVNSGGAGDGRKLIFGVRPENVVLEGGAPVEGRVFDIEDHGVIKILTIETGGAKIHATVSAQMKVKLDEVVRFGWKPEKVLLFDAESGANLALA